MHFPWWFPWAHLSLLLVVFPGWNVDTFDVVTVFTICIGQSKAPSTYESQNRLSRPTPSSKQGQLEQVSQDQSGFECFRRLRCWGFFKYFLMFKWNVWYLDLCPSEFLSIRWIPLRRLCLRLLFTLASAIYTHWEDLPEPPFLQFQLSQILLVWVMLQFLNHLHNPLLDLL